MLDRAEWNKAVSIYGNFVTICVPLTTPFKYINTFVDELCWEETDGTKCNKICVLKLDNNEWEQVSLFLGLLSVSILDGLVI